MYDRCNAVYEGLVDGLVLDQPFEPFLKSILTMSFCAWRSGSRVSLSPPVPPVLCGRGGLTRRPIARQAEAREADQHHRPGRCLRYGNGRQGQAGARIAHVRKDIRHSAACIARVRSASCEAAWRDGRRGEGHFPAGQVQCRRRRRRVIPYAMW
jgi:hypothetical protein